MIKVIYFYCCNTKCLSMKYIMLYLIMLSTMPSKSYDRSTYFGIGVGTLLVNTESAGLNHRILIQSPFYTSQGIYFDKTITRMNTPNFYVGKRIYRQLFFRLNGNYSYRSAFMDYTGFIFEQDPNVDPNKHYYYYLNFTKTLNVNAGLSYNLHYKRFSFYPALEVAPTVQWIMNKAYYNLLPATDVSYIEKRRDRMLGYSINLLLGMEYKLGKHCSLSYEMGLYQNYFAPVSRLSMNVNF